MSKSRRSASQDRRDLTMKKRLKDPFFPALLLRATATSSNSCLPKVLVLGNAWSALVSNTGMLCCTCAPEYFAVNPSIELSSQIFLELCGSSRFVWSSEPTFIPRFWKHGWQNIVWVRDIRSGLFRLVCSGAPLELVIWLQKETFHKRAKRTTGFLHRCADATFY